MVFSSFVFLFLFLPVVLVGCFACPPKARNFVLVVLSLLFYAWGEPVYVLIMLFSTVFDYTNGRLIAYAKERKRARFAKAVLIIDLAGNLAILGFFKYSDFLITSANAIAGTKFSLLGIALPIGISFYTFQTMSYTIDVYRGVVPAQRNIINFAAYVTLFPQLIAGPIVQYKTIAKELDCRRMGWEDFSEGAMRFSKGLAKKVILANQIGSLWTQISGTQNLTVSSAWLGAIAYTFQIYFDFSGYSDMAIGLGRMLGFHFLENFDHPYIAKSITEFWRRWHISLSSWFREYVYIPLGGNRRGTAKTVRNLLIVWALTGLWHGASVNFILWGLYYGVLLIIEKYVFGPLIKKCSAHGFGHLYTMFFVVVGWIIFAQTDLGALGSYLKAMAGIGVPVINSDFFYYLSTNAALFVLLVICSLDWARAKRCLVLRREKSPVIGTVCSAVWMLLLLCLSTAFLVGDSYNPFLYFRF